MNIFDIAKKIEVEGEQYYRELAESANDEGLRTIFTLLADNEVKHYQAFEEMERNQGATFPETNLIAEVKGIFSKMRGSFDASTPQEEVYKKALRGEEQAVEYYEGLLAQTDNAEQRQIIEAIIAEERQHVVLMRNMVDFLEAPKMWLENAEFNNMEAY